MRDVHERVAVLETEMKNLAKIPAAIRRLEWMVAIAIGSGILSPFLKGCL